ncbi:MAG: homocysteine S-methyltransferase family protein [Akkermansiaceae bacterium]|nr:homocysteine S-methyltransferase family protein [Akkermansiaceae bacterium]MCF7730982.1 homocysteine S-methyltransferase family protein [Akkermansiaceae bacterium]
MSDFLTTLQSRALLCDGAMGSYLFKATGRLSETNHVYEHFNLRQPELIAGVHQAYLAAGSHCLKTNTFGANLGQLATFGLEDQVEAINRSGMDVARGAIARFEAQHGAEGPFFVMASVGPTVAPLASAAEVDRCYRSQIETLVAAGADALLLETFQSLPQLEWLIGLIGSIPGAPPVIAQLALRSAGDGGGFEPDPLAFINRMAELGVPVAGVNCCAPWDASAFVDAVNDSPAVASGAVKLVVMPNASGFQRIGSRLLTTVNPESAGKMARSLSDRGVRLIGGCCEMHPPHIQEMHNYLQSRQVAAKPAAIRIETALPPVGDAEKSLNGPFSRKLKAGQFVVSLESLPPRGTDERVSSRKIEWIGKLAASGLVDAVDFTDGSRGIPLVAPGDFIHLLRASLGWTAATGDPIELIPHFTARDLNLMGVQSRLVGYHANRIHNVLFVTGDPPKMSPSYPRSTAVFDLDSVEMIRLTEACLNAGADFGGVPLGKQADPRTHFTIGAGVEPEAQDMVRELSRLQLKIASGVDYIMTQPVFHQAPLAALEPFRSQVPILIGVMVLTGFEHARRMSHVPGVVIPDAVLGRFSPQASAEDQAKVGREIAAEQIRQATRDGWPGIYLMSTATMDGSLEILRDGLA